WYTEHRVRPANWLFLVRLATVVALAASAALYVDYTSANPAYCGVDSGCAAVRASGYGYVPVGQIYLPVPALGLIGFSVLLVAALLPALPQLLVGVAGVGGVAAGTLLVLQAEAVGRFCSFCVAVDVCALVAAGAAIAFFFKRSAQGAPNFDW